MQNLVLTVSKCSFRVIFFTFFHKGRIFEIKCRHLILVANWGTHLHPTAKKLANFGWSIRLRALDGDAFLEELWIAIAECTFWKSLTRSWRTFSEFFRSRVLWFDDHGGWKEKKSLWTLFFFFLKPSWYFSCKSAFILTLLYVILKGANFEWNYH